MAKRQKAPPDRSATRSRMASFRMTPDEAARLAKMLRTVNARQHANGRDVFGVTGVYRAAVLAIMDLPPDEVVSKLERYL